MTQISCYNNICDWMTKIESTLSYHGNTIDGSVSAISQRNHITNFDTRLMTEEYFHPDRNRTYTRFTCQRHLIFISFAYFIFAGRRARREQVCVLSRTRQPHPILDTYNVLYIRARIHLYYI